VCCNGLVIADANFAHAAIRHFDVSVERFATARRKFADSTPRMLEEQRRVAN